MLEIEQSVADEHIRSHNHFEVLQCIDRTNGTGRKEKVLSDDRERLNFLELMSLSTVPMALKAITLLDVPQIMADAEQGTMLSARQISKRVSSNKNKKSVNVNHLDRILRFLASCDIFRTKKVDDESGEPEQVYGLTPICKYLLRNAGGASLSTLLLVRHDKQLFQSLHHLHDAVLGDDVPFAKAHDRNLFEFLEANPQESQLFNTAMSDMSEIYMEAIVNNYHGFKDTKTLVDVGGGTGSSLAMILAKYPHIHGINFDLPHVVAGAPEYDGMKHVGGNMFEQIPGGDGMYLKHIMHNWSDDACIKVLNNCYKSLKNGGKIIMVEFLAPDPGDHSQRARVALSYDLVMMAHFLGKERSEREFRDLLRAAGFSQIRIALRVDCVAVVEAHKNPYAR
ncbi:hypothetical protein SELMODRAFT_112597 [Selaginella moellendorffii]|uniref:O-methyltransferase domain-containing protein n=1 Tax=Selaginella moellendorffii TaxID=88036 RepID=D8SAA2_SELML|nr:hypothetical protein SELMODRAFT_112597 [Selaginella moellendorffii]